MLSFFFEHKNLVKIQKNELIKLLFSLSIDKNFFLKKTLFLFRINKNKALYLQKLLRMNINKINLCLYFVFFLASSLQAQETKAIDKDPITA